MGAVASPEVIGRYAVYGKLASGGMASVHFGRLLGGAGFSRTVAIKRLHPHLAEDPDFLSTMLDEARLAARIQHPNVVPTLDVVSSDGELLLVMEYVRGESLARLLKTEAARGARVALPIVGAIVIGTLHGLHAAHEATNDHGEPLGIVHRDVSPQNILVGADGVARVIDFGVAKAAGRLQETRDGVIKGKIAYMAPEQLTAREVTRRSDVYAMGAILWEALVGRRLFQADNDPTLMSLVLAGASEPPSWHAPGLPLGVDEIVMTALSRDPAQRFPTALDMAEALMRVLPPAFPTDVGRWCMATAQQSLARRGTLLADIESSSGIAAAAPSPASVRDASGIRVSAPSLDGAADEAPTIASQSSSLPAPTAGALPTSRRALVAAGVLGGLLVFAAAGVLVRAALTPDRPVASAAPTEERPAPAPPVAATAAAAALPTAEPAPAAPSPAPSTAPDIAAATSPAPPAPPAITPTSATAARPAAAPRPPATPAGCNPPYEFDSAGHKKWKRECL
jgi:serine/threonine-protein kinase